jgi:hypothetical protein
MTFRQWLCHVRQWLRSVIQFPMPLRREHSWVGIVGRREQTCLICDAIGTDRDISDEELEQERKLAKESDLVFSKYFSGDGNV